MAKYYVYELIDPRDAQPFYVGKGSKSRIHAHENDARRGVVGRKCDRIREIWACGRDVERRYVQFFSDERAAYEFEARRIAELDPRTLTNIWLGTGSAQDTGPFQWTLSSATSQSKTIARVARALSAGKTWIGQTNLAADFTAFLQDVADDLSVSEFTKVLARHNITLATR